MCILHGKEIDQVREKSGMKAVLVDKEKGAVFSTSQEIPKPKPSEALVKVTRVGICNTDLEILKGYMKFTGVLGHEFLGVIEQTCEGNPLTVGSRVVGEINLACERCEVCQAGGIAKRNHCPNRTVLGILDKNGTFAEYLTLPVNNLFLVPDSLTDAQAVFSEPLAAAYRIVEQLSSHPSQSIAVIGDGKLGNLIVQVMCSQPHSKLTHFGKYQSKLDKVPQSGVDKVLVDSDTSSKYRDTFDVCVEASGTPGGLMMAGDMTKPLGTVVLKSTCAAGAEEFNTAPFVVKEISVIGSRCGNFDMALKGLQSGDIQVDQLIDGVYSMDKALDAIKAAAVKGTMKIQIEM